MPPRVGLTMIVKNEEANLPLCLGCVDGLFHEIVVVDTGSSDQSRQVAARLGARVFDFPWGDDFSAARNQCLCHATADWLFWLDADDRLDDDNRRRLQALLEGLGPQNIAYVMPTALHAGSGPPRLVDHIRLFRNHPELRWCYRVHEQIRPALVRLGALIHRAAVTIDHVGYEDAALARSKLKRNLRLLMMDHAAQPDNPDILFHLGKSYLQQQQPAQAIPLLRRSLQYSRGEGPTEAQLYVLLGQAYRRLGDKNQALATFREGRDRYPDHAELLFHEGCLHCVVGRFAEAEACLRRSLQVETGAALDRRNRAIAHYNLGVLYHQQGRTADAIAAYHAALQLNPNYDDARKNLAVLMPPASTG